MRCYKCQWQKNEQPHYRIDNNLCEFDSLESCEDQILRLKDKGGFIKKWHDKLGSILVFLYLMI